MQLLIHSKLFQQCKMEKWFRPTLYNECNNLPMVRFKLIHVSKRGACSITDPLIHFTKHNYNFALIFLVIVNDVQSHDLILSCFHLMTTKLFEMLSIISSCTIYEWFLDIDIIWLTKVGFHDNKENCPLPQHASVGMEYHSLALLPRHSEPYLRTLDLESRDYVFGILETSQYWRFR